MPIINKGIFEGDLVYARQTGNDWPTAQVTTTSDVLEVSSNLYFTAARANAAIYPSLTTANVIETSANLYFTVARVNATVQPFLTTANVVETAGNLYYTNARANAAIYPSLTAANIANFVSTVNATVQPFLTTANVVETSANLYFTNARANAVIYPSLTAANIANFISTVNATVRPMLTTANVVETSGNLYFTAARANAAIYPSLTAANIANFVSTVNATVQPFLTTANVVETSGNLYFTNARVIAALSGSNISVYQINANVAIFGDGTGGSITGANLISAIYIQANTWLGLYTSNVIESPGNLYFTAERVNATIQPFLTTANVVETSGNLYFTNARVISGLVNSNIQVQNLYANAGIYANAIYLNNIAISGNAQSGAAFSNTIVADSVTSNIWNKLYTANVIETSGNLYFTNARANAAIYPSLTAANIANFVSTVNATVQPFLTTANVVETSGNLYFTNSRVASALIAGNNITIEANGRISANASSALSSTTTDSLPEGTNNLYYTNSRVVSAVVPLLTTANVTELSSNLYYTNARARTALTGGTGVAVNWSTGAISIGQDVSTTANVTFYNVSVTNNLVVYGGTETFIANNLVVSDNMIYLNSASINSNPDIGFAANYNDGVYHHTGFFRDASDGVWKVFDNYSPEPDANIFIDTSHASFRVANIQATTLIGNITGTAGTLDNFTTTNLKEGSNLYFTVARVNATVQPFLTTANVIETSGNLYFTNARAVSALTAGDQIIIEANGRISANVVAVTTASLNLTTADVRETSNLYFTNARVASNVVALFTPNGNVSAYASKYIVEYNPSTKVISYSSTPDASNPYISGYSSEIHVSPVAFNDSGNGTIGDPVKTIARAQELAALAFETTGAGQRKSIILHPGDYTENVTISTQYTVLTTHELIGKNTTLSGTLTITKGCTIDGLKMTNLVISAASADGSVDIIGCTVTGTTTKTSTAYTNFRGCDLSTSTLSITGAGTVVLSGGNYYTLTVNNASVAVLAKAVISMGPITLTAGTLQLSDTLVYSATNTANAITQSAGSVLTLNNSQTLIPDLTNVSRNSFGGYYSILSSVYDRTNSTFGGVSLNSVVYDQYINADRLILNGSTSGSTILNATGVAGSTTLTLPAATDTLVGKATTDTLTNKTLSNAVLTGTLTAGGGVGSTGQVLTSTVTGVQWTTSTTANASTLNLTTADVRETSNLYYTNARARTAFTAADGSIVIDWVAGTISANTGTVTGSILPFLTTANVSEVASNLYFTAARVNATVQPFLTTANVVETSGNLYYTNARANAAIYPSLTAANIANFVSTVNATVQPFLTTANVTESSSNLYFTNARANAAIYPSLTAANIANFVSTVNATVQPFLTTANVVETSGNLYFTAARANATIYPSLTTANVIETNSNLYFTVARVNATVQPFLTTANVVETSGNLYYTNARARTAFTAGDSTIIIDWTAGTIKANVSATTANSLALTTADVREVASNLYFTSARVLTSLTDANISGNLKITGVFTANGLVINGTEIFNSETGANLTVNSINANIAIINNITANSAILGTGFGGSLLGANLVSSEYFQGKSWLGIYTANVVESPSNLYFTVARVNATVQPFLTTANVVEASSNLYFTNARVVSALIAGQNIIIEANGRISANVSATTAETLNLTTANVVETSGNIYFTNARVLAALVKANVYVENLIANGAVFANAIFLGAVNVTSNILSGSGATFSGDILTGSVTANIWNRLYTANVIETSGNLYFTNTRVVSALVAGQNITIESNGRISAATNATTYVLTSTQRIQCTGANVYTLNASVAAAENILVVVEGLVQIPSIDYTVSGTTLTLSDSPTVNSNIEIRYYGTDAIYQTSSITTKVDSFIGTGANTYTLTYAPPSKDAITVVVNGVYRQSDQYTLNNKNVFFNVAPALGSNVDIRTVSGNASTSYNTRTYTANGTSNTFVITDGFTQDTILVFENGVTQVPGTDYTVAGNNVYFATAPAANILIQIRELGITGTSGPNVIASIRGLDQSSGTILPSANISKNLGSSAFQWNNSYVNQSYIANVIVLGSTTISTTGSSITLSSGGTTTTISGPTQSSRAFGLALIFGG